MLLPEIDTEPPKKSPAAGVGLLKVCNKLPLRIIVVVPFGGSVTDDIESMSPSASVSFAKTSITTGVFSSVVAESSFATGDVLLLVIV